MTKKEIKTEVVELGENLAIPLPKEFCTGTLLVEGAKLTAKYVRGGVLQIQVEGLDKSEIKCQVCNKGIGKYTCSSCGSLACSNCFWELGNMCNNCIKR